MVESTRDASVGASKGEFLEQKIRVFPMFAAPRDVEIPLGVGGHGGADPIMLADIFLPDPPADPLNRAASHVDGAASILTGICANKSIAERRLIRVDDVFSLAGLKGNAGR